MTLASRVSSIPVLERPQILERQNEHGDHEGEIGIGLTTDPNPISDRLLATQNDLIPRSAWSIVVGRVQKLPEVSVCVHAGSRAPP